MASETLVKAATGLFALAIFSGFTAPLIAQSTRRQNGEIMLAAHAGLGIAGFVLYLAWISNM